MRVLPLGRLGREEVAERRAILRRGLLPVALDGIPAAAESFLIGIAVLRDDRGDSLRVARRQAEAHRCAVVEDIDRITSEPGDGCETVDDVGEVIKGVLELRPVGRSGEAEARQVGGDYTVVVR